MNFFYVFVILLSIHLVGCAAFFFIARAVARFMLKRSKASAESSKSALP